MLQKHLIFRLVFNKLKNNIKSVTEGTLSFTEALHTLGLNPWVLGITAAIAAISGLVKGYDTLIGYQEKAVRNKIEDLGTEISDYDAEIQSLEQLQEKLQAAKGNKQALAQIQKELNDAIGATPGLLNGESGAYDQANGKLQAYISLKKSQRDQASQEMRDANKDLFDNNTFEKDWAFDKSASDMRDAAKSYSKHYNEAYNQAKQEGKSDEDARKAAEDHAGFEVGVWKGGDYDPKQWDEYWTEQSNTAHEAFSNVIKNYDGAGGQDFVKNIISSLVKGGAEFEEIEAAVNDITGDKTLQSAIDEYYNSLADPSADSEASLQKVKELIDTYSKEYPELAGYLETFYSDIQAGGSEIKSSTANTVKSTGEIIDSLSALESKLKSASDAWADFNEDGTLSTSAISKIKEDFAGIDGLDEYIDTLSKADLTAGELQGTLSEMTVKLMETELGINDLANADEAMIAKWLEENNVLNANQTAHELVTNAKIKQKIASLDLTNSTDGYIDTALNELRILGLTETQIQVLSAAYAKAQVAMTQAVSSSALKRLGMTEQELKGIKSAADAYRLLAQDDTGITQADYEEAKLAQAMYGAPISGDMLEYEKARNSVLAYAGAMEEVDKIMAELDSDIEYGNVGNSASSSDPQKSAFDKELKDLQYSLDKKEITEEEYYNRLNDLNNQYFKDKADYLDEYRQYEMEVLDGLEKVREDKIAETVDNFEEQISALEHEMGLRESAGITDTALDIADYGQLQEYYHELADYYRSIDPEKYAKEIRDLQNKWWDAENAKTDLTNNRLDDALSEIDRYTSQVTDSIQKQSDAIDDVITREQALLDIKQKEYDITNSLISAQRDIDKELAAAKISREYLDEETRKLIFNEDDYNKLSSKIAEIADETSWLANNYYEQINSLAEGELYKIGEITAEYERQLAMKERELEIAQAEVDLQKKQDQLNNVLAEKNVRQFVDGRWVWTHNTDDARQAAEELADAQARISELEMQSRQQIDLDERQARIDQLNTQKGAYDQQIAVINEATDKLKLSIENIQEPIQNIGTSAQNLVELGINPLQAGINSLLQTINNVTGRNYNTNNTANTTSSSSGGRSSSKNTSNATATIPGLGKVGVHIDSNGKTTTTGLPTGTIVHTSGGDYKITGGTGGNYSSEKVNSGNGYAKGTLSAESGWKAVNENGEEVYLTSDGVWHNFRGGETVFSAGQTRNLYELSKLPLSSLKLPTLSTITPLLNTISNAGTTISGNTIHFHDVQNGETAWKDMLSIAKQKTYNRS